MSVKRARTTKATAKTADVNWKKDLETTKMAILAKEEDQELGFVRRKRQLEELVYSMFRTPAQSGEWIPRVREDLYWASEGAVSRLARRGGSEFEKAVTTLKLAGIGKDEYRTAIRTLGF